MVRVFACAGLSALSHSSQSVFRYGRSSMHVPNLCACVCIRVGERSLTPTVDTGSVTVWTLGCVDEWESRPACPHRREWILIIQSDLNLGLPLRPFPITPGWADIAVAWKATDRQKKAEEGKLWCAAKRHPRGFCYQLNWGERNDCFEKTDKKNKKQ